MSVKRFVGDGSYRIAAIGSWALLLVACVAQKQPEAAQAAVAADVQPRVATYDCGEAGSMTIEYSRAAIRVTDSAGASVGLPEVPESGGMRYAQGATAVVLDGPEALVMSGRTEPVSCRR